MQELDFLNEANNQIRMKKVLSGMKGQVFVPDVMLDLSTRRVLVSEWVDGVKLTKADPGEVGAVSDLSYHIWFLIPCVTILCFFMFSSWEGAILFSAGWQGAAAAASESTFIFLLWRLNV